MLFNTQTQLWENGYHSPVTIHPTGEVFSHTTQDIVARFRSQDDAASVFATAGYTTQTKEGGLVKATFVWHYEVCQYGKKANTWGAVVQTGFKSLSEAETFAATQEKRCGVRKHKPRQTNP